MGLYLNNGFVNIEYCLKSKCPFTFVIGGRGTGKTFGAQLYAIQNNKPYMLLRRTQAQADLIGKPEFSPVNPVMDYLGLYCKVESKSKYNSAIYSIDGDEKTTVGYTGALSTFSNLRGFSGDNIDLMIFDEFIPELHERPIKGEADAFFNVYETINRNRELQDKNPLITLCLSNSNSLASPILTALGLTKVLERMERKGQSEYINIDRGIAIYLLTQSPISDKKSKTALYKATAETDFSRMALNNEFAYDDMTDVKSISLNSGWKLFCRLGDMFFYIKNDLWYISKHGAGKAQKEYEFTEIGTRKFVHDYPNTYKRILNHKIIYEDFSIKSLLTSIFF